jgi:hypothetical protein
LFHRLDGRVDGAVGRHQNHDGVGTSRFDMGQQICAVGAGEAHIRNHEIVETLFQSLDGLLAVAGCGHRIAFALQGFLNTRAQARFVFYDKDVNSGFIHAARKPVV